jgi:hypothetical protein
MNATDSIRGFPTVTVQFCASDRRYDPLQSIGVRYQIELPAGQTVRAIERSILWYTEGKGEEDLGIHSFERIVERMAVAQAAAAGSFHVRLPRSPLSYEGLIVKIRWCVRVRLFFDGGRDFVSEHVFDLGRVPAAISRSIP